MTEEKEGFQRVEVLKTGFVGEEYWIYTLNGGGEILSWGSKIDRIREWSKMAPEK